MDGSRDGSFRRTKLASLTLRVLAFLLACGLVGSDLAPAHAERGVINDSGVQLRAGLWKAVVGGVPNGAEVQVNARTRDRWGNRWDYVTTDDGDLGWVYGDFVTITSTPEARVGVQVGHWRYLEAYYPLDINPGSILGSVTEVDTNLEIALALARRLSVRGIAVDLLPTLIPAGYSADAVVAIHCDADVSYVRGFFVQRPGGSPVAGREEALAEGLRWSIASLTGIPYVDNETDDSREYYGFRAVDKMTPIVLVEAGHLTNAADRSILVGQPGLVADVMAGPIADLVLP